MRVVCAPRGPVTARGVSQSVSCRGHSCLDVVQGSRPRARASERGTGAGQRWPGAHAALVHRKAGVGGGGPWGPAGALTRLGGSCCSRCRPWASHLRGDSTSSLVATLLGASGTLALVGNDVPPSRTCVQPSGGSCRFLVLTESCRSFCERAAVCVWRNLTDMAVFAFLFQSGSRYSGCVMSPNAVLSGPGV